MKPARSSRPAAPRAAGTSLLGRLDLVDQLMLLLVGVVVLMVNLGLMGPGILAYWPIILVIYGLKELLRSN